MNVQSLVETYGYVAVFIGCVLEGETVLVLAGTAAHLGYLALPLVIGVAATGAFLGDQLWFLVGRRYGPTIFQRWPKLQRGEALVHAQLDKHGAWIVMAMRFAVGLRMAIPLAMGASTSMSHGRFALLNALGAVVWSILFSVAGYVFGATVTALYERARHEGEILLAIALGASVVYVVLRHVLARRREALRTHGS